jgi:hypothetical protein
MSSEECPICYDPLYRRGKASYHGSCGHAFHVECLNRSVAAGNSSECPLCKMAWETDRVVVTFQRTPLERYEAEHHAEREREGSEHYRFDGNDLMKALPMGAYRGSFVVMTLLTIFNIFLTAEMYFQTPYNDAYPKCAFKRSENCGVPGDVIFSYHGYWSELLVVFASSVHVLSFSLLYGVYAHDMFGSVRLPIFSLVGFSASIMICLAFAHHWIRYIVCVVCIIRLAIVFVAWKDLSFRNNATWSLCIGVLSLLCSFQDAELANILFIMATSILFERFVPKGPVTVRLNFLLMFLTFMAESTFNFYIILFHPTFPLETINGDSMQGLFS